MHSRTTFFTVVLPALGLTVLILDTKTALLGAAAGIDICIYSVIPTLLPFFILSNLLSGALIGKQIRCLAPLRKLCGIPKGAESLFLIGLVSGYPVGAQTIAQANQKGQLSERDAKRLLGFFSNAGPSFIFGIAGVLFDSPIYAWLLWLVHILSAVITGILLPHKCDTGRCNTAQVKTDLPSVLVQSLRSLALVCGWIVIMRVLITFFDKWFFWLFPDSLQVILTGTLELANGCYRLFSLESMTMRFIICSGLLAFGGICVGMQTVSVLGDLGTGMYFPGKLLQSMVSTLLAMVVCVVFFYTDDMNSLFGALLICTGMIAAYVSGLHFVGKITVAFSKKLVYNGRKCS